MDNPLRLRTFAQLRPLYLIIGGLALLGPNALFLYYAMMQPELLMQAARNPVALAFMIEASMLLLLFLAQVWALTRSWSQALLYLGLAILGSLAFSLPVFIHRFTRHASQTNR